LLVIEYAKHTNCHIRPFTRKREKKSEARATPATGVARTLSEDRSEKIRFIAD